jgi:transcriptional regulator with XRE-family HTH domain
MEVGREIRRLREEKGWSQAKLAGAAGMGVSGVSQIETGARNPSAVTLVKMAEALDVEVADFFPKAEAPLWLDEEPRERRITPVAADVLEGHLKFIARLKEQREAEMEEIRQGATPPFAWIFHLEAADSYLRKIYEEAGILGFVEEVAAGRMMASFEGQRLCHQFSRQFSDFQKLTDEARILDFEKHSDTYVEAVKGTSELERWMQAPEHRGEGSGH